jgi:PhzF family phenazine biosynthesis protein
MKVYYIDSFTSEMFKGNPAAVCLVETAVSETGMLSIAAEIGFSETAFINRIKNDEYGIRFFTPKEEIALCGHATLAAAKIVFELTALEQLIFINKDGIRLPIDKADGKIRMQFPAYDVSGMGLPATLLQALGIQHALYTGYNKEINCLVIEIESSEQLQALKPDFAKLLASYQGIAGVLVTAKSNKVEFDFEYRYFWPWIGTDEDPVTGAVQTFLTPYWANKLGKTKLKAFQASQRTGVMGTALTDRRVYICGDGVKVLEGMLNI